MAEYNTKVEGHRGEAARLEIQAQQLLMPAAKRKELAAELRAKAQLHWQKAQDAAFETYAEPFEQMQSDVAVHLDEIEELLEPIGTI